MQDIKFFPTVNQAAHTGHSLGNDGGKRRSRYAGVKAYDKYNVQHNI